MQTSAEIVLPIWRIINSRSKKIGTLAEFIGLLGPLHIPVGQKACELFGQIDFSAPEPEETKIIWAPAVQFHSSFASPKEICDIAVRKGYKILQTKTVLRCFMDIVLDRKPDEMNIEFVGGMKPILNPKDSKESIFWLGKNTARQTVIGTQRYEANMQPGGCPRYYIFGV